MSGRPISDEHIKELLEGRLKSIKMKKADEHVKQIKEVFSKMIYGDNKE